MAYSNKYISALAETEEPTFKTSTIKIDAHTAKWLNYKVDKSTDNASEKPAEDPVPPTNQGRRPSAFSRLSSYTSAMSTTKSSLSSDSNSDSNSDKGNVVSIVLKIQKV